MKRTEKDLEKNVIERYKQGDQIKKILGSYGIGTTAFYRILKRNDIKVRDYREDRYKIIKPRKCKGCGKLFKPRMNKLVYCNKECYLEHRPIRQNTGRTHFKKGQVPWNKGIKRPEMTGSKHPNWKPKVIVKCATCGRTIQLHPYRLIGVNANYCSRRCSIIAMGPPKTAFKKGLKPWNKDKVWSELFSKEKCEELVAKDRERLIKMFKSGNFPRQTDTDIETKLKAELEKRGFIEGVHFIHQFVLNGKFLCDFVFPIEKLIVECDGDYWHANPNQYDRSKLHPIQEKTVRKDIAKDAYIKKIDGGSWKLLRFWGLDISKNVSACVDKIEKEIVSLTDKKSAVLRK